MRRALPSPMKAVSGDLPASGDWAYEVKWDGMRLIADVDPEHRRLELMTTNRLDATARFPELAPLADALPVPVVIDGEVVALVDGRPDFGRLQHRMHIVDHRQAELRAADEPVHLVVFDVLEVAGEDVTKAPWTDRRRLLEQLIEPGPFWRITDVHDDGAALLTVVRDHGLEGIVAKQRNSAYAPGRRSAVWRKIKVRDQREFVVGGWTRGEGARGDHLGALLLGHHVDGELRFVGRVGTGFDDAELRRLRSELDQLEAGEDPFTPPVPAATRRVATFAHPEMVVEVAIGGWTPDGQVRHASYLGPRADVDAADVTDRP